MAEFTKYLTSGLALGALYGLVLGRCHLPRFPGFNFAHGELLTFGAVVMVYLSAPAAADVGEGLGAPTVSGLGLPWGVALMVSMVLTGLIAMGVERIGLRPLVGRPVLFHHCDALCWGRFANHCHVDFWQ